MLCGLECGTPCNSSIGLSADRLATAVSTFVLCCCLAAAPVEWNVTPMAAPKREDTCISLSLSHIHFIQAIHCAVSVPLSLERQRVTGDNPKKIKEALRQHASRVVGRHVTAHTDCSPHMRKTNSCFLCPLQCLYK